MNDGDARQPAAAWRLIRAVAAVLVAVSALLIALIAAGAFDPRPFGPLVRVDHPGVLQTMAASGSLDMQTSPWSSGSHPDRYSVRLTAALADGEADSGYGLALVGEDGQLLVAVSPTGYVTVREMCDGEPPIDRLPWQPWPHVRPGTQANEIWLDARQVNAGIEVTAWVNREQLWSGTLGWMPDGVALWLSSFGVAAAVDFSTLEWFAAPAITDSAPTAKN
jgi:hypothetical protein